MPKLNEKSPVYLHEKVLFLRTSVNTAKGLRPVRLFHRYFYNLQSITIHYLIFIFRLTGEFTVILPLVTRTLDNSNLPLTGSNFCFPSDDFYII